MLSACVADAGGRPEVVGGRAERRALVPEFAGATGDGEGADVVIEAAGNDDAWQRALELVRPGGTVLYFGGRESGAELRVDAYRLHYEELTLRGAFHHAPRHVRAALAFLASGAHPWQRLITHRVRLEDVPGAPRRSAAGLSEGGGDPLDFRHGARPLGRRRAAPAREGRDGRDLAAARRRGRDEGRRPQPGSRRARASCRPRPTRMAPRRRSTSCSEAPGSRGRTTRCTRCGPATASSTAPTSSSTRSSPGRTASTTSSSAHGTRRTSAGCRARKPSASAGRGSRAVPTTRGTARRRRRRSRTESPLQRPPNILNIDEVELEHWGAVDDGAARDEGALRPGRLPLGAARPGRDAARCRTATPRRRRSSSSSRARERSYLWPSPSFAPDGAEKEAIPIRAGHVIARPPGDARQPLVPRRRGRPDDADLRHAQAERHVLVPALEQDRLARARRDRPDRGARLRRRRARGRRH